MHLKRKIVMLAAPATLLAGAGSAAALAGPTLATTPVAAVQKAPVQNEGPTSDRPETAAPAAEKADVGGNSGPDLQQGAQFEGQFDGEQ